MHPAAVLVSAVVGGVVGWLAKDCSCGSSSGVDKPDNIPAEWWPLLAADSDLRVFWIYELRRNDSTGGRSWQLEEKRLATHVEECNGYYRIMRGKRVVRVVPMSHFQYKDMTPLSILNDRGEEVMAEDEAARPPSTPEFAGKKP